MKSKIYFFLFLFLGSFFINAQSNHYYYYKGEKKYLTIHKKSFTIFTNNDFQTSSTANLGVENYDLIDDNSSDNNKFAEIELISEPNNNEVYNQKLNTLQQLPNVNYVGIFFENGDAEPVGISKHFYVKLKNVNDYAILQQTALQKNVEIVKQVPYMPKWYIMAVSNGNPNTSLDLGNQFYETGLFDAVDPAFMLNFSNGDEIDENEANIVIGGGGNNDATCSYDPNFNLLWGLKNSTNPNIDINACQAWQISQGLNVNIAIVDDGIYMPHPDLADQFSSGYDAQTGMPGSVYNAIYSHGTNVAGIVAAVRNNNKHIVGVAPRSKIIPISHDLTGGTIPNFTNSTISAQLASGISWAVQNYADIINNSWGAPGVGAGSILYSTILEEAIIDAMEQGRDTKGCVVIFGAGNGGNISPNMFYPGNFDNRIMTVGAITKQGARWYKSSYGNKLDVVAPGHGIWTTTPNNGIKEGEGTSLAAPHISGVAALILSVNPCLTGQEVRNIIEQTAQKVGSYSYSTTTGRPNGTWNNEMGHGLVDAYAAVLMARNLLSTNPCEQGVQEPLNYGTLENVAPNPATTNIQVNYILKDAYSATLMIVSQSGNSSNIYNLDLNSTQINISISNYLTGLYTIALIVNGEVVGSKILIKQ